MDTLSLAHDWILLLDADEVLTPELIAEIQQAIQSAEINGYYIALRIYFLGRVLRHGDARFWKLSLFRRGKGKYECRLKDQDSSMADMEVHEHVVVVGKTARLQNPVMHHNIESLSRYQGQSVCGSGLAGPPLSLPISLPLGFLDGVPGLIYCGFQAVQMFHTKSKVYELRAKKRTLAPILLSAARVSKAPKTTSRCWRKSCRQANDDRRAISESRVAEFFVYELRDALRRWSQRWSALKPSPLHGRPPPWRR